MTYFLVRTRYGYWEPEEDEIVAAFDDKDDAIVAQLMGSLKGQRLSIRYGYDDPADVPDLANE
jgi:hypothetical protein